MAVVLVAGCMLTTSCGKSGGSGSGEEASASASDQGAQVTLVGPLADYFDVSLDCQINEEYTKKAADPNNKDLPAEMRGTTVYDCVIEFKKNSKAFEFDVNEIEGTGSRYVSDNEVNKFYLDFKAFVKGKELRYSERDLPDESEWKNLVKVCNKPDAKKVVNAMVVIAKDQKLSDLSIEIESKLKLAPNATGGSGAIDVEAAQEMANEAVDAAQKVLDE